MTPRLCVLFHAGASGDSSPLRAFPRRGIRWLLTFARFSAQGDEVTPLHREGPISPWISERVESSTHGRRWCGAGFMWMRVSLYTWQPLMWGWHHVNERLSLHRQPLMWGWFHVNESVPLHMAALMWDWNHVNERLSSTHGRPLLGGWYRVNREQCLPDTAATYEGLVSCEWVRSQVIVLCTRRTLLWAGGCKLRQWVCPCGICGDMRTHSSCICPRFSAPPWKGNVRSRADVLSSRFDGWEECGHSRHKLITRVLKVHPIEGRRTHPKKKSYSPERCRGAAIQACPREWTSTVSCNSLSHTLGCSASEGKGSDVIVAGSTFILPRARHYLHASRQLACHLDWREPIGLQERLERSFSHNGELMRDVSWKLDKGMALRFVSFEADTEAVMWFSGEWSFGRHRSHAFGKTNQAPIQCFDVRCLVFLIQASKPRCRTSHH